MFRNITQNDRLRFNFFFISLGKKKKNPYKTLCSRHFFFFSAIETTKFNFTPDAILPISQDTAMIRRLKGMPEFIFY